MALVKCPECGNQMSDTAEACPHCGYQTTLLLKSTFSIMLTPTKTGEVVADRQTGGGMVAGGILVYILSLVIGPQMMPLSILAGLAGLACATVLLYKGTQKIRGYRIVVCPHCRHTQKFDAKMRTLRCPNCYKQSYYENGYMKPVV